jgi:hypothetical protein
MSKVNEPIGGGGFSFGSKAPNAIDAFSFSEPIGGGGFSFGSPAPHNISFGMQSNSDLGVRGGLLYIYITYHWPPRISTTGYWSTTTNRGGLMYIYITYHCPPRISTTGY